MMSRAKGDIAEERATLFLSANNFCIIERNFSSRFGEIDIIASKDGVLHFVEVKSGKDYELAIQNITPTKLSRFTKTVYLYLKKSDLEMAFCIDAIIVTSEDITLLENITV